MSELINRPAFEERIARELGALGAELADEITTMLGNTSVSAANITPETWEAIATRFTGILLAALTDVFTAAAQQAMEITGFTVDFALANEAAATWARNYTFELVRGITDNSKKLLQAAVDDYFRRGLTIGDLQARITATFGPVRAAQISQTEVTRAAVEGERFLIAELQKRGAHMKPIHKTNADDRVCPICGPRHEKEITDGVFPPLHVGCRCWVDHEPVLETI